MATESSLQRKKFGVSKAPIQATRAFVKTPDHVFGNADKPSDVKCWMLFNDQTGTRISVNTYNGNAGKGFVAKEHPIPTDTKEQAILTKGYDEVPVAQCPVAVAVQVAPPAPKPKRHKAALV